jgi:hypothetical protein
MQDPEVRLFSVYGSVYPVLGLKIVQVLLSIKVAFASTLKYADNDIKTLTAICKTTKSHNT